MTKPKPKPTFKERLTTLYKTYGKIAVVVYFSIFAIVYLAFLASISAGIGETDTAGTVGTAGAAWLATKVTQPFRIAATFVLTPLVARLLRRQAIEIAAEVVAETKTGAERACDDGADSVDEEA